MIPKEIIERAVEGEWMRSRSKDEAYGVHDFASPGDVDYSDWQFIVCDSTFWKSLGRALRKDTNTAYCAVCGIDRDWQGKGTIPQWHHLAHRFFDLLLTSGDIDAFWTDLLANDK